jgi:HEAT repeat protein
METPRGLIDDLRRSGVRVEDLWELVGSRAQYRPAIPVLIDWLEHVDDRVNSTDRPKVREGLVRALSVPAARPSAVPVLLAEFRNTRDPSGLGLGWVLGNALSVVTDDSTFDQIASLVTNRDYGKARQMIVLGLGRSKDPRAVPLLVGLLDDDDVVAHALMALGKLRPNGVHPAIARLLDHPLPLVRREARKALNNCPL